MVEKKEGNTMTCNNCGIELICRIKDYGGEFEAKPQWQNQNGEAHYHTNNGKDFICNVPKDDEAQEVHAQETTVETNTSHENSTVLSNSNLPVMDNITLKYVDDQITLIRQIEDRVFSILGKDVNVAKVGMYVKLILEGINRK